MPVTQDDDELDSLVRKRIRALRVAQGWSLEELAARARLSQSSLSRIENGQRRLALDSLVTIARALDTSLDQHRRRRATLQPRAERAAIDARLADVALRRAAVAGRRDVVAGRQEALERVPVLGQERRLCQLGGAIWRRLKRQTLRHIAALEGTTTPATNTLIGGSRPIG